MKMGNEFHRRPKPRDYFTSSNAAELTAELRRFWETEEAAIKRMSSNDGYNEIYFLLSSWKTPISSISHSCYWNWEICRIIKTERLNCSCQLFGDNRIQPHSYVCTTRLLQWLLFSWFLIEWGCPFHSVRVQPVQNLCSLFSIKGTAFIPQIDTDLLQYHDKPRGWRQLVVHSHVDGKYSQHTGLRCRQDQTRAERKPQLRGEAVVQRSPKHQREVGHEQGVDKHHSPGPGDRPQLPKGKEQQVELQDQPEVA